MSSDSVLLAAVGDTAAGYDPPEMMCQYVLEALRAGDIRFAQVETICSEREHGNFQHAAAGFNSLIHPRLASAYKTVPFDVVGLASNHSADWGPEGVQDTIDTFRELGIPTIGAGLLPEARKPAIVERKGLRVAFLSYCSVLLPESWATEERVGAAPMRVKTYYEPYEYQPGAPARVVTIPDKQDLEELQEDVRAAKRQADCVVVSMHWGIHFIPRPLTDYQPVVGHAAIDAGASVVLGHHPHLIQGIEQYKGGVIFYGLGNFAFYRSPKWHREKVRYLPNTRYTMDHVYSKHVVPGFTYRYNQFWPNSLLAYVELDRSGVKRAEVVPAVLNSLAQPEIVAPDNPKFEEIREYVLWASEDIDGGIDNLPAREGKLLVYERS